MITKWEVLLYSAVFYLILFVVGKQFFNFILRGFAPFISSRPWVIEQMLKEVKNLIHFDRFQVVSIGSGRSGFLNAIEKEFPGGSYIGVEDTAISTMISRLQIFLKRSKIKVINSEVHRVNVSNADLIYCKLSLDSLRDLDKKFKFECKPGAIIMSNGFVVPNLEPKKTISLDSRKGRFSLLSGELKSTMKKSKKENKIFVYEI